MDAEEQRHERDTRRKYSEPGVYRPETITVVPGDPSRAGFSDKLLAIRFSLVEKHQRGGIAVDLCCGTGLHLLKLAPLFEAGIGVDFSLPFLAYGHDIAAHHSQRNVSFLCGSARSLPDSCLKSSRNTIYPLNRNTSDIGIR